jgi:inositol 1,4,5-triphosphate receptor type 1/inositol 1,4,5-triphosphate receptor type 3
MPLYYKIDRLKYIEENSIQNKKSLRFYQKIYIILIMTIYDRDYILTLIFEFIFSLIGTIMKRGEIIYAFLLLPIIDLNNILKNIIVSIRLRYKEVALTFTLAFIIMYLFSNMAYFFFNQDFSQEIEYMDDNVCKTLIFCFLNALDSGLRARGGIADSAIRLSYSRNKRHYIRRLIMDDFFFILIVIIAIDLVFGIIIGAFNTLRDEETRHSADRKNHCFICHVNKNTLEKNRQNFNEHRTKVHNIWNYVDYMMALKFSDVHDLNAINSYANQKMENKDISWLPTYKDLKANGKNGRIDELEEELKVEDENVNKYFVKMC